MVKCTKNSLFQKTNKFAIYNVLFTKMCQNQMSYIIWMEKYEFCNIQLLRNFWGFMKLTLSNSRNKKGGLQVIITVFIKTVNFSETNITLQDTN